MIGKYKNLMVIGWVLAFIFAISTIVLSVVLYKAKAGTVTYLPQETVNEQIVPGTDSNSESVYIYYDDGVATEEEVTHNYSPSEE